MNIECSELTLCHCGFNQSFICRNKEYYFDFCVCYLSTDHMYRRQLTIEQRKQYAFLDSKIASMEYDKLRVIEICEAKLKQVNLMDVVSTIVVVQVCFVAWF